MFNTIFIFSESSGVEIDGQGQGVSVTSIR